MLQVHEQTAECRIKTGELPAVALGRKQYLDTFLEEHIEEKTPRRRTLGGVDRAPAW
jgi:hypothetical protein